jgi:ribosomal protein S18 acetylase RimI-like enzyme
VVGPSVKLRYEIDLTQPVPQFAAGTVPTRTVMGDDLEGLAQLMLDAYRGTIDYEDEDLDDALAEVRAFFERDHPLTDHSFVAEIDGVIVSAVLVSLEDAEPFIGYVMTLAGYKNQGLARLVTAESLASLARAGYPRTVFYITDGNRPSEALFRSLGAALVHPE